MKKPLLLTTVTLLVVTVAGNLGWRSRFGMSPLAQIVADCENAAPGTNCGFLLHKWEPTMSNSIRCIPWNLHPRLEL